MHERLMWVAFGEVVGMLVIPTLAYRDIGMWKRMEGEAFSWKSYLVQCLWEFGIFNIGLMVGLAVAWS
jgi:hypothetical protein